MTLDLTTDAVTLTGGWSTSSPVNRDSACRSAWRRLRRWATSTVSRH